MKGALHPFSFLIMLSVLAACSSRSLNTELTRCVFPDSPRTPAAAFICDPQISGYPITVLRSSAPSDVAVSDRIQQVLDDQIKQWSDTWSTEWFDDVNDQTLANTFLVTLLREESRVVRSRVSPKSHLWLLIGLPLTIDELKAKTKAEMFTF